MKSITLDSHPIFTSPSSDTSLTSDGSLGYLIAKVLHAVLPKTWFCWVSRGTIQLQSILRPEKWSYWSNLSNDIFLGGQPLKNWNHIDEISNLGIKAVLSINKSYELQAQIFADPVQPEDWEENEINFLRISSPDLKSVKVLKLDMAVNFVENQVKLGNPVLIHCTGGRGRSVSVAVCSLSRIRGFTLEESIKYVKQCRPQAMINQKQMRSITAWYEEELKGRSIKMMNASPHASQYI